MKKEDLIYVSGATGLVGRNLVKKLKESGYDNIITREHNQLDLTSQEDTESFIRCHRPMYIYHCASIVGGIQANINEPYKFLYENLMIQNNIINCAIKYNVEKTMYLASACMFPRDYKQPLKESYLLEAPVEPTNEGYALSKICGTKLCEYANKTLGDKFIILSPTNLYGIYDHFDPTDSHVLQSLIKKIYDAKKSNKKVITIWGTGEPRREFLYVEDLADCMVWAMNNIKSKTFLNVGTGKDASITELAETVARVIEWKGKFKYDTSKPDGMKLKCLDVSKINKLGWKATTNLEEGIEKTVEYYKELISD